MRVECPACHRPIPAEDLNAATDVAVCKACGEVSALSRLLGGDGSVGASAEIEAAAAADPATPPPGCWLGEGVDGFAAGGTTRSCAVLFLLPFTLLWGGGAMAGIYGTQIARHQFDLVQSLFGIPFLIGSIALLGMTLFTAFGRCEVVIEGDEGRMFTGFLGIGRTRRFDWRTVKEVRVATAGWTRNRQPQHAIEVVPADGEPVRFGSVLTRPRRAWLLAVLRQRLRDRR